MKHREPDITGCDPPFVSSVSGARVRRIRRALLAPFSNCSQRFLPQEENTSRGCSIPDNCFCYSIIIYSIDVVVCFQELHKFQILWVSTISLIYSITACGGTLTGPIIKPNQKQLSRNTERASQTLSSRISDLTSAAAVEWGANPCSHDPESPR